MTSGIYAIINTVNGKRYVGSSINIEKRWRKHIADLNKNSHHCQPLQRAWVKYGQENFQFQVIEIVSSPSKDSIIQSEQKWIDHYASSECGYNVLPVAYSHLGAKRSQESRQKLSEALKRKCQDPSYREKMKETAKSRGVSDAFLQADKTIPEESRQRIREKLLASYILTSPEGDEILVQNLSLFCQENGLNHGSMRGVFQGQYRHYRGWRIRRDYEPSRDDGEPYVIEKTYTCTSPDGVSYSVENLKEFCAHHGLKMNAMASTQIKSHRGWTCVKHEKLAVSDYTRKQKGTAPKVNLSGQMGLF